MPPSDEFDFSGDSVAAAYDDVLVPVLFGGGQSGGGCLLKILAMVVGFA